MIYVNGRNIVNVISEQKNEINFKADNNWGPEDEYTTGLDVAGLSVSVMTVLLVGRLPYASAKEIASVVGLIISWGLDRIYYRGVTQFNYVDYAPKVGYKLTEEIHKNENYDASSLMLRTSMTGSR